MPDFYLTTAGEYRPLALPRACSAVERFQDGIRDDYMLVEIEPPLAGRECRLPQQEVVSQLLLASKWRGLTLFPVSKWPMPVYVMVILDETIMEAKSFRPHQVRMIAWGTLYETVEEAIDAATEFQR